MTDLPLKMRGVWLTGHGDMDRLEIRQDIPVSSPGPSDVLIRVLLPQVLILQTSILGLLGTQKMKVPVKMPADRVSPLNSRAFRGPMCAGILSLWVKKLALTELVNEY